MNMRCQSAGKARSRAGQRASSCDLNPTARTRRTRNWTCLATSPNAGRCCSRSVSTLTVPRLVLVPDNKGVFHIEVRYFDVVSHQGTTNYLVNLQRQFERWKLEMSSSRALQPSGFGALARQDDLSVRATGSWGERLTLSSAIHGARLYDASGRLQLNNRRYYDASFYVAWQCTELWSLQTQVTVYLQHVAPEDSTRTNTAVFLTLTRQLNRKSLN